MRARTMLSVAAMSLAVACADPDEPVTWAASIEGPRTVSPDSVVPVRIEASMADGWYFYSVTQPGGGPIPARIWLADGKVFLPDGEVNAPRPTSSFDSTFGIAVEKYLEAASFTLPVRVAPGAGAGRHEIHINALFQACNNSICLSPRTVTMSVPVTIGSR